MRLRLAWLAVVATALTACGTLDMAQTRDTNIQLGPRPFFLVEEMAEGPLKTKLQSCSNGPFSKTAFSIGHRGAPLMFPEHTKESYEAAAQIAWD